MKTTAKQPEADEQNRIVARRDFPPSVFWTSAFCLLPSAFLRGRRGHEGSAIVFVMLTVCVLSVVAASLLLTNVSRYQTTFQSASWQEAIIGSEAGVDLAMNELRKRVITGPAASFPTTQAASSQIVWTTTSPQTKALYANYGHAFPANNQPYLIATHGGDGNQTMQLRVFVDVPGCDTSTDFAQADDTSYISQVDNPNLRDSDGVDRSRWLFRIRSLGITNLTGPPRPNLNKYDNLLRRFSFFNDWRTGQAVSSPQVARMVEAVVRPETGFRNALMADVQINLSNKSVLINSYDSSKGVYSAINQGNDGNIATNGQLINASSATVEGNAMTNNGSVANAQNVTGQDSSTFYQELQPITVASLNPAWAGVTVGQTVTTSTTYTASNDPNNPTLVRLNGINLLAGVQVVNIVSPKPTSLLASPTTPSYIKVYVQGDISTVGTSYINLDPNVNAIFYVTGNINLQGNGILNNSLLSSHLLLNGLQPTANADGSFPARSLNVATSQNFEGIIYAPNYDLNLALVAVTGNGIVTSPNTEQINNVLAQINSVNADILGNQTDYQQQLLKYTASGDQSAYKKMQQDQTQIANDQAQLVTLQQQLVRLDSGANPTSAADDYAQGYNGIYGGFVAKTITVASKTHIHYDEVLRTAGPVNHYEIVNWFEDNLSHDTAGGAEAFWWPTP